MSHIPGFFPSSTFAAGGVGDGAKAWGRRLVWYGDNLGLELETKDALLAMRPAGTLPDQTRILWA